MTLLTLRTLVLLAFVFGIEGNLLAHFNPYFEIQYGQNGFSWGKVGSITLSSDTTARSGSRSLKVSSRSADYATAKLELTNKHLKPGHHYYMAVYLNYLNNPTGQSSFDVELKMKVENPNVQTKYYVLGRNTGEQASSGWNLLMAEFTMPTTSVIDYTNVRLYLKLDSDVDFLMDDVYLHQHVSPNEIWDLNPDVELAPSSTYFSWREYRPCTLTAHTTSNTGQYSLKVSSRTQTQSSPTLLLSETELIPLHSYHFAVFLNYLNAPSGQSSFDVSLKIRFTDSGGSSIYRNIMTRAGETANSGWQLFHGVLKMPSASDNDYEKAELYILVHKDVDFLFDTASLGMVDGGVISDLNAGFEVAKGQSNFHWGTLGTAPDYETHEDDAYQGGRSVKVYNRPTTQSSLTLTLGNTTMLFDHSYFYSFYIKFLDMPSNQLFFNVSLKMRLDDKSASSGHYLFESLGDLKFQWTNTGWLLIGADFHIPPSSTYNFQEAKFYIKTDKEVDFLMDAASLVEIPTMSDSEMYERFAANTAKRRTNKITVNVDIPETYDMDDIRVEVNQIWNSFLHGMTVKADNFTSNSAYRNFVFNSSNLVVLANANKWKIMEFVKREYKKQQVDDAIALMEQNDKLSRSHVLLWGRESSVPPWLTGYNSTQIKAEVKIWLKWYCDNFGDSFIQHDVYNEFTKNHWFEEVLNDRDFLLEVFDLLENCTGDLYMNDYAVLREGRSTVAHRNTIEWLLDEKKNIAGTACQTHVKEHHFAETSMSRVLFRLRLLCSLGLPVMITELTVDHTDADTQADKLEDLMRLFYSEDCVIGINYWTTHDSNVASPNSALTSGTNITPTKLGLKWMELIDEWTTRHVEDTLTDRAVSFSFYGHHGNYTVRVLDGQNVISQTTFTLPKGQDVTHAPTIS